MDKLIEAAQGLIALGPPERAQDQLWSTWQKRVKAYNLLVAAASHAAESAPMLPSDTLHICAACWAGNHGSCSGGKCGCVHESASVAQLDAEDQHPKMRAANAEARKGYVKLEDVEKVIREFESKYDISRWTPDYLITELRAHLAPKPEPSQSAVIDTLRSEDFQRANACIECGTLVVHQELHAKWQAALADLKRGMKCSDSSAK